MICCLCYEVVDETWDCVSCDEQFCDVCYDLHFQEGPHIPQGIGNPTSWFIGPRTSWPRLVYNNLIMDGSGRDVWIPEIFPVWFAFVFDKERGWWFNSKGDGLYGRVV